MDNSKLYQEVAEHKRLRKILKEQKKIIASGDTVPGNLAIRFTLAEFDAAIERADGKCEICKTPTAILYKDHCHKSGKFRGLVCQACNTGLGMFMDDELRLAEAINYLRSRG